MAVVAAALSACSPLANLAQQPDPSQSKQVDTIVDNIGPSHHDAETDTIFWNGQYVMYFRQSDGPYLRIGRSISTDGGNTFTYTGVAIDLSWLGCNAYAPSALLDHAAGHLVMAYEVSCPNAATTQGLFPQGISIGASRSTDSINWDGGKLIAFNELNQWWEGSGPGGGNIGTPQLYWGVGNQLILSYHGFNGALIGQQNEFTRGYRTLPLPNNAAYLDLFAPGVQFHNGTAYGFVGWPNWEANNTPIDGIGMARVITVPEATGTYYYMVFEAWTGTGPFCTGGTGLNGGHTALSLAVANSPIGPFVINPQPLVTFPPFCGYGTDEPSWQYLPNQANPFRVVVPYCPALDTNACNNSNAATWTFRRYAITTPATYGWLPALWPGQ